MICLEEKELPNIKKALYTRLTLEQLKNNEKYGVVIRAILDGIDATFCDFEKEMIERIQK